MKFPSLRHLDYRGYERSIVKLVPRVYYGNNYIGIVRGGEVNLDNLKGGRRESISYLTSKSRKNMLMKIDEKSNVFRPNYMLTLTYPSLYPTDGQIVKDHLRKLFAFLAGEGQFRGVDLDIKFFWKMEFQARGAPHFHILVESKLDFKTLLEACVDKWCQLTGNQNSVCVDLGSLRCPFLSKIYLSLHFSKDSQNRKPAGFVRPGRFWGMKGMKAEALAAASGDNGNYEKAEKTDGRDRKSHYV